MPPSRVRRRALACARCRRRKIQCDARSPSCTKCLEAGDPCLAFDSVTKRAAPRSIVQFLEMEIVRVDGTNPLIRPVNTPKPNAIGDHVLASRTVHGTVRNRCIRNALADRIMNDFTPQFLGLSAAIPFARCIVGGTRIPSTRAYGTTDIDEHHPRSIINPLPRSTPLSSIPIEVSVFLFENYITRVTAQYPVFYTPDLVKFYNSVFHAHGQGLDYGSRASPYEICIISLVMAISLTTAARTQQARASSIASGMFRSAMLQMPRVLTNDIPGLQALLLLLQYTFLDPAAANIYYLSGFTSQACIDLGLHEETERQADLTLIAKDIRRRVFWCTYEMEVAVCAALLRPTALHGKHSDLPYPTQIDDRAITASGINPAGHPSKTTAHKIWSFRKLECEAAAVLFHGADLTRGCVSVESWTKQMENAVQQWCEEVHASVAANTDASMTSKWSEMQLYAEIVDPYMTVLLHRPSSRVKEPNTQSLMKAFIAAPKIADGYFKQANVGFGSTKYVFHPCHHSFSAAIAFLQALRRCKGDIAALYTVDQVKTFVSSFSRLFSTYAERWPEAARCLEEYEKLLAPVKHEYLDFIAQHVRNYSKSIPNVSQIVNLPHDPAETSLELDDLFTLGSLFQPAGPAATETHTWLYDAVPLNWNVEFDFGMN